MSKPTIVIVPGSFTSAAAYETLASVLAKQYNYEVIVGTLQSTIRAPPEKAATLQEDAAYFRGVIEALLNQGKDVVVVGHSYGGIVATESVKKVTHSERQAQGKSTGGVTKIIYVASIVAEIGETAIQAMGGQLGPTIKILGDYMYFDTEAGASYLYDGLSSNEALETGRKYTTIHATTSFLDPATNAAVDHVPVTYIHTAKDNIVPPERQQQIVESLKSRNARNVSTITINEGHMPQVLAPEVLAKAIVEGISQELNIINAILDKMAILAGLILYASIPAIILLHLLASPHTKVEESFHIQATHDILTFGIPSPLQLNRSAIAEKFQANYDHFSFPGAVPRTFIGALALASASGPVIWFQENVDRQLLVRAILGLFNAVSLIVFARGIQKSFGNVTAYWYLLFQASQFHVAYYASRTLSNMFAFGMTTLALRLLLPEPVRNDAKSVKSTRTKEKATKATRDTKKGTTVLPNYSRYRLALVLFTVAGIIFRSELALLLATNTIYYFLTRRIRIWQDIIPAGIIGLLVGLTATVIVDSYFWQEFPLWPEFSAFKFNVVSGQASAWGTDPWYFYFTSALPRLLLNPLTCFQPHKEWRFIIYIIPALTAAAAQGAANIWTNRGKSILYRLLSFSLVVSTLGSFLFSTFILLPISSANYPGAQAIQRAHFHGQGSQPRITLYMGNLACQTGVTRFLQQSQNSTFVGGSEKEANIATKWEYDKTEDPVLKSTPEFWSNIDYALVEDQEFEQLKLHSSDADSWEIIDTIVGFGGFKLIKPSEPRQHDDRSSIEIDAIRYIAGDKGVIYYKIMRDEITRRLTRGYWAEMSLVPRIRVVRHSRAI
ncbi:uncharacterized protein BHQ10_001912 [Talaromyces amestolkiae]|uniref:Mannosyltransferase n=1 Tax=Talaromyces amestolkiae TaxID=1196081 RepID=A0A364KQS2_TALAM|nr:uncharacterized protein BHQ10_001912 [Talaromyces amestolkiae]RAO65900.1 hypothetical protein BHQ10_001912 [Talaromyces amestolkiae]